MKLKSSFLKRTLSFIVVLCMVLSPSLTAFAESGVFPASSSSVSDKSSLFEDVTGKYQLADKTGNFNSSVKTNNKNEDTEYWIFVTFDGKSVSDLYKQSGSALSLTEFANTEEAAILEEELHKKHSDFLAKLEAKCIPYTGKYSYTLFTDAISLKVRYRDVNEISSISGVKKVSFSEHYSVPEAITENNANVWGTGIYKTEGIEYDGRGLVVAVLDTGLDQSHAAFQTMPDSSGVALTKEIVNERIFGASASRNVGLLKNDGKTSADDVYYNAKVPFAYDYADKDSVVYPSYSVHGTHVAGIIAGNLGDKSDEPIKDSDGNEILGKDGTPLTFRGVAPEAQLVICKVFTDLENSEGLGGAETVDILAALEDCVKLGVDVINMSLGSSAGFSEGDDDFMINVYKSIREAGISLVVAASNDYSSAYGSNTGTNLTENPDSATVGSPSTFAEALSVASISGQKTQYMLANNNTSVIFFNEVSDANGNKKEFVKEILKASGNEENATVELPYVAVQLYGQITGYTGLDVKDKIVLVERGGGNMTFEEKVRIAKMKGALGVIIYNNVSGNINMTIGGVTGIPVCSITMDASKSLLANLDENREGKITISASQLGGPFMSDFSSWGPTPSLNLKPEVTAHGGDITSAVPGGWDTLSGTSMAAPNMAGAYTLVLQYIRDKFPAMSKNDQVTLANRLIMSTTVIANDEFGTPYSPRKQGAGLATIKNAIESDAYLFVDGSDKTKIELGDDKDKNGIYDLTFKIANISDKTKSYSLSELVMTETVIENKGGVKTVAEHAYMLNDKISKKYFVNGSEITDGKVSVAAGETVEITVKITLSDDARKYLDDNFKNGMYVEGFVCLKDSDEGGVDLSIPFLAFYGDWYAAPMFDLSTFDEAEAKQDDSIPDDEKPQAAVYATVPLGSYYNGKYIIPLGTYLYNIPSYMTKTIYASEDKVAISMYDSVNHHTAYQLYSVYTGLLRGAKYMDIKITDTVTGEVIYSERQTNIRKAFSGGSSTASAANVLLELSPLKLGLANNRKYQFEMSGTMDRVTGEEEYPEKRAEDSFSFTFYVDNEAPELVDYRVRFDPYKEGKETKYKVYLDMDVYDNQYAQSLALCYLNTDKLELSLLTGDMIPIEGSRGSTTTVSVDVTEYYYSDIDLYIQVDDYALNSRAYRLSDWKTLADAVIYPEVIEITDGPSVTMNINEVKSLSVNVSPNSSADTNLYWTSSDESVVRVYNGELYSVGEGSATVTVYGAPNAATKNKATITVNVTDKVSTKQIKLKSLKLNLLKTGDDSMMDPTNLIDVHPNTTYILDVTAEPWYYPGELDIHFSSSSPDVASVDEYTGVVKTMREGTAYITATQYVNGKPSAFAVTAKLNVGPEFDVQNGVLRGYYGLGGKVTIPKSLNVYYIYEEAFKDNNNITELEISSPCMEIQHAAFSGMTSLKRVILPQSVTFVASDAFKDCTALERIDLRSRAITFNDRCFQGCSSLKYVNNLVVTDNSVDTKVANILDLDDTQFLRTSPQIGTLGNDAFKGCTSLESVDITELRVSGSSVFSGCTSLKEVTMSSHTVLGDLMFEDCSKLSTISLTDTDEFFAKGAKLIFSGCAVTEFRFKNGTSGIYYVNPEDGCYYTDNTLETLVFVPQNKTSYTAPSQLKTILAGAFAGNRNLKNVNLGSVEKIGDYAFADTYLTYNSSPLTVPSTVTEMGEGVFYSCPYLAKVKFDASVSKLPARTFEMSGLDTITLNSYVKSLGDYSLAYTDLVNLDLSSSSVSELGNYVLAYTYLLETVKFPALSKVGRYTFFYAPSAMFTNQPEEYPLRSVSFAEGTTSIGKGTFYGYNGFSKLTEIILPDSVKNSVTEIGDFTFYGCTALNSLNLGKITSVGDYAFYYCASLEGLDTSELTKVGTGAFNGCVKQSFDLTKVKEIGDYAFANTSVQTVDLSACEKIGKYAFSASKLHTINNLNSVKTIGDYAFKDTFLNGTFTLPATLKNERGSLGVGLLMGTSVSEMALDGTNDIYFTKDGVLFSVLPNGSYQIEIYPCGKVLAEYTVPDGVVRIQDSAFATANNLKKVSFASDIKAIGDKAFYKCSATSYSFSGLNAPVLEAYIVKGFTNEAEKYIFSQSSEVDRRAQDAKAEEKYYANFSDYAALVLYPELSNKDSLGLSLSYPSNAAGFEGRIWNLFFENVSKTDIIPEQDTKDAIDAIEALPEVSEINALKDMSDKDNAKALLEAYKSQVKSARSAYNKVTNVDQKTFITDDEKLFNAELAIRNARKAFGETITISELRVKTSPTKLVYTDGEMFDATGMVLTVIYDDSSEEDVSSGFTLPLEALTAGQQMVTFTYMGIEKQISITVNNSSSTDTETDTDTDTDTDTATDTDTDTGSSSETSGSESNGNGLKPGVIVGIIVGIAVVAAGSVCAVWFFNKKKLLNCATSEQNKDTDNPQNGKDDGSSKK